MIKRHIVIKYLRRLNLRNYKEYNDKIQFSCPICGDSKKNTRKARGNILNLNATPYYYCHNCLFSSNIYIFFKNTLLTDQYNDFLSELKSDRMKSFVNRKKINIVKQTTVKEDKQDLTTFKHESIVCVTDVEKTHISREYLFKRAIPVNNWSDLYYFKGNPYKLFNEIFKSDKYKDKQDLKIEHEGIIIPFRTDKNIPYGFSLRRISGEGNLRYINLVLEDNEYFFNQQKVDWRQPVYILEGQFDVLSFKTNNQMLAMCSVNRKFNIIPKNTDNVTYIVDNEYTNDNVVKAMKDIVNKGYKLFIWPNNINIKNEQKLNLNDINNLVILGLTDSDILSIIQSNTYKGKMAEIMLIKKINEYKQNRIVRS